MTFAIRTENLTRIYKFRGCKKGDHQELFSLNNVNIEVQPSELFGLLGHNGAGKTILIKILTTLLSPSAGKAWVSDIDVSDDPVSVRRMIDIMTNY